MTASTLQDFILKDEQNLRVAHAVSAAWPETCERIGNEFLDRLETVLKKERPRWETNRWDRLFRDKWAAFEFYKPEWERSIALQFGDRGKRMQFGVLRSDDLVKARHPLYPEVLDAVRPLDGSARSEDWWEAFMIMRSPATDWQDLDVLWRMHTDQSFLDEVAGQMIELARRTESILDRLN